MSLQNKIVALVLAALFVVLPAVPTRAQRSSDDPLFSDKERKWLVIAGIAVVGALIFSVFERKSDERAAERARSAPPDDMVLSYDQTTGRLADHVEWKLESASCPGAWQLRARLESGTLPTGLSLAEDGTISGEAEQPGRWTAGIRVGSLSCTGRDGQTRSYRDQLLRIQFTITD